LSDLSKKIYHFIKNLPENQQEIIKNFQNYLNTLLNSLKEYNHVQNQMISHSNLKKSKVLANSSEYTFSTCSEQNSTAKHDKNLSKSNSIFSFFTNEYLNTKKDNTFTIPIESEFINEKKHDSNILIFETDSAQEKKFSDTFSSKKIQSLFLSNTKENQMIPFFLSCNLSVKKENESEEEESKLFDHLIRPEQNLVNFQDFNFLKLVNRGAYGKIWLASRKKTDDLYAIKIIDIFNKVIF